MSREQTAHQGLAGALVRTAGAVAASTALFEAALSYRLWAQLTASVPASAPWKWLYRLSGPLVEPFYRYDTVTPIRKASVFEFPALIAMEAYLFIGVILVALLLLLGGLARGVGAPNFDWSISLAYVRSASEGAGSVLRRAFAAGRKASREAVQALTAACGRIEWRRARSRFAFWRSAAGLAAGRACDNCGRFLRGWSRAMARNMEAGLTKVDWRSLLERLAGRVESDLAHACSDAAAFGLRAENLIECAIGRVRIAPRLVSVRIGPSYERLAAAVRSASGQVAGASLGSMKNVDAMLAAIQRHAEERGTGARAGMALLTGGQARLLTRRQFMQRLHSPFNS